MVERIWDRYLTERDKEVFGVSGYGATGGVGRRPALLVIDVTYNFTGDVSEPILESLKRWRNSCGEEAWAAIPVIKRLQEAAHAKGIPVIYTNWTPRGDHWDLGSWSWKNSRTEERQRTQGANIDGDVIVHEIAPEPQDIVVYKLKPSGFYGTNMSSFLTLLQVDSVIVTGTTTSGCVRATVVDAFSENYRVAVVEDGCFDRSQASHAINLYDMHAKYAKYADVVGSDEVSRYFDSLPDGLFDLPEGVADLASVR